MKKVFTILLLSFLFVSSVQAYVSPGEPTGFVNDFAGVMSESARISLNAELTQFEKDTGHEISIVTVQSLQEDVIENFAVELFAEWGIGKKGEDNGVLFLIAMEDRMMRIEVGYGLEGALTDLQSFAIIDQIAKPNFQAGDFDQGIGLAVKEIQNAIKGEPLTIVPQTTSESGGIGVENYIGYLLFFFFVIVQFLGASLGKTKRIWPGGVIGGVVGAIAGLALFGAIVGVLASALGLGLFGLIIDWGASRKGWFKPRKGGKGGGIWFLGGGRGGSGGSSGGFGGFGGGMSGGGGSSGSW